MGKLRRNRLQMVPAWWHLVGNQMCRSGFMPEPSPVIKVITSDGLVKTYDRPIKACAVTAKFPKHKVCGSEAFYIGQKISAVAEDAELQLGLTYFLLPTHFFQSVLTFATVTSVAAAAASTNCQVFEIQKTETGFLRIRVRDEFISRLMVMSKAKEEDDNDNYYHQEENKYSSSNNGRKIIATKKKNMAIMCGSDSNTNSNNRVCTTPELHKEYKHLVLIRRRLWKPKLDVIKESARNSSRRVLSIPASFQHKKRSNSSTTTTAKPPNAVAPSRKP